jgi:hypothetical protein
MRSSFKRSDIRNFLFESISSQMFEQEEDESQDEEQESIEDLENDADQDSQEDVEDQEDVEEEGSIELEEDDANMILGYIKHYTSSDGVDVRKRTQREEDLKFVAGDVARVRDEGGGKINLDGKELQKLQIILDFLQTTSKDKSMLKKSGQDIKVTGIE